MDGAQFSVHTSGMIRHDFRFHIVFFYLRDMRDIVERRIGQLVLGLKMLKRTIVNVNV